MTPDDIDWPPPCCNACRWSFHDRCLGGSELCECLDCTWLYEGTPPWLLGRLPRQ